MLWPRSCFEVPLAEAPTVVAFASVRDIVVGEELTIDYNPTHKKKTVLAEHEANASRKVECLCGAGDGVCRKWVF